MTKRPNILLITTDQQHFTALGATNPAIKTPNIDRLCEMGTRFDRAYCPSPVCTPSRASIITGQYPSQHGAWTIGVKLPEETPTVGAMLSEAGYKTGLIGKAHFQPLAGESLEKQPILRDIDFWRGFTGPFYGFDHIELVRNHADEAHVGQHYAAWMEDRGLADWQEYFQPLPGKSSKHAPKKAENAPYWAREERSWALPEDMHYTPWIGDRSLEFIEAAQKESSPFFLWTSFPDPHPPYTVPEPWASMYDPEDMEPGEVVPGEHERNPRHFAMTQQPSPDFDDWHVPYEAHGCDSHLYDKEALKKDMAVYYGMMSFLDQQIGRILDHLESNDLLKNTLIVFTTDHGHFLGQHGLVAKGPFHYEDMLRIPFAACWPGRIPASGVCQDIQSLIDLTPTFLEAAGVEIPGGVQGVSQMGAWERKAKAPRRFAICENRHNPENPHVTSYIEQRYKISVYRTGEDGELFDLENDPNELTNLWHEPSCVDIKSAMLERMVQGFLQSEPMKMPRLAQA